MPNKIKYRYRGILFALIMSFTTALIVSGVITFLHSESFTNFLRLWPETFIAAWPIVFVSILVVAPKANKILRLFVEDQPS